VSSGGGRPRARLLAGAGALLSALLVGGCGLSNLQFTKDNRLHFVSPRSRQLVGTPVTLNWTISGFRAEKQGSSPPSPDAGYFAIFVDRAPVKPGQTLLSLADKSCRQTAGCFNPEYLAERNVYTTTSDSLTIDQVPALNSYENVQVHEATIVLMNTAGQRIGESAWYLDFRLRSKPQGV
jgi:hypothetical protein